MNRRDFLLGTGALALCPLPFMFRRKTFQDLVADYLRPAMSKSRLKLLHDLKLTYDKYQLNAVT